MSFFFHTHWFCENGDLCVMFHMHWFCEHGNLSFRASFMCTGSLSMEIWISGFFDMHWFGEYWDLSFISSLKPSSKNLVDIMLLSCRETNQLEPD